MPSARIELRFLGKVDASPELEECRFFHPLLQTERHCVRGKTSGAFRCDGTFQWTSAVRAICSLFLLAKLYRCGDEAARLIGDKGTLASSLDYAISKQPVWLLDMFGQDSVGNSLVRRLVKRSNPERKRGAQVTLSLNNNHLSSDGIVIYLNGNPLIDTEALLDLNRRIVAGSSDSKGSAALLTPAFSGVEDTAAESRAQGAPAVSQNSRNGITRESYPAPFDNPYFYKMLQDFFVRDLRAVLFRTDIFNRRYFLSELQRTIADPYYKHLAGKSGDVLAHIADGLDTWVRLGLGPSDSEMFAALDIGRPIRVALNAAHAAFSLFHYLKKFRGLPLEIDYHYVHTAAIKQEIVAGNAAAHFDCCLLTVAVAATLFNESPSADYLPCMAVPANTYRVMGPRSSKGETKELAGGEYLLMSQTPTTSLFYFKELQRRRLLDVRKVGLTHMEQDEIVASFRDNEPGVRGILWFPYDRFNQIVNDAVYLDEAGVSLTLNEFLFVHRPLAENRGFRFMLEFALRDAWIALREHPALLREVVEDLLKDPVYLKNLGRCGGLHNFDVQEFSKKFADHPAESPSPASQTWRGTSATC